MWNAIQSLDRILRGEATRQIRQDKLDVPVGGLAGVVLVLGAIYGACMGAYAVVGRFGTPDVWMGYAQLAASAAKVPLLFFLTLVVTFPSLYVFNALLGSRLGIATLLRLLVATLGVIMALLASFGTIAVFFAISTDSYAFMVLLNVVLFAVAGFLGLGFLLQTLHRLFNSHEPLPVTPPPIPVATAVEDSAGSPGDFTDAEQGESSAATFADVAVPMRPTEPGPLDVMEGHVRSANVKRVFQIWVIVFGLVGAQMSWVLRPFIGSPNQPFSFFRTRESNFFEAVKTQIGNLLSW